MTFVNSLIFRAHDNFRRASRSLAKTGFENRARSRTRMPNAGHLAFRVIIENHDFCSTSLTGRPFSLFVMLGSIFEGSKFMTF